MRFPLFRALWLSAITAFAAMSTATAVHAQQHIKRSRIVVYNINTKSTKVIYEVDGVMEAPNWSPDGKYLLVNTGGNLYKLPLHGLSASPPVKINLGTLTKCNNDKSISPDGKLIAFSSSGRAKGSQVYTVPSGGGVSRTTYTRPVTTARSSSLVVVSTSKDAISWKPSAGR